jgi:hypothetical protein
MTLTRVLGKLAVKKDLKDDGLKRGGIMMRVYLIFFAFLSHSWKKTKVGGI